MRPSPKIIFSCLADRVSVRAPLALAILLTAAPARALAPEADALVLQGLDAAYSLDLERAAALFTAVSTREPEHPVGPFFLASLKWLEFSQNADLPGAGEALAPQFEALLGECFARAWALREKAPDDPEADFYLGAAYGMKGRWLMLERKWIRAAHAGYKGYKLLKRTVALDPEYYDAYLGLGMYDYYSDTLPAVLRFAAGLIARGDRQRGLRYVELTRRKGHYSVTEAKLFLAGVYAAYEKRPAEALAIVAELRQEKPDNVYFGLMEVIVRLNAKDWAEAAAAGEALAPRIRAVPAARDQVSLFELYLGEAYLGGRENGKAIETLDRCVAQAPEPRRATVTFCLLRRAQAYDLAGRRAEALADYRAVRERPDYFDSRGKARKGLSRPVGYEEYVAQLLE